MRLYDVCHCCARDDQYDCAAECVLHRESADSTEYAICLLPPPCRVISQLLLVAGTLFDLCLRAPLLEVYYADLNLTKYHVWLT